MALMVTFVSGPRRSGKSTVLQNLIAKECRTPPHYLRLAVRSGDKRPPPPLTCRPDPCGVATARWLDYESDEIIAVIQEALDLIHRLDRYGVVFVEGDSDPHLRHAYPYDKRLFVMPLPRSIRDIFRTSEEAAGALREVMDDTAAFASEIYGLLDRPDEVDAGGHERRDAMSQSQWWGFLNSPLGDELATRIQFQPQYHGLVDSDVLLINRALGANGSVAETCLQRIERLLQRIRGHQGRTTELFCCDPLNSADPQYKALYKMLAPMCRKKK